VPRAPSVCVTPGCPNEPWRGKCRECRRKADLRRPNANARGYTSEWSRVAKAYLADHPLCECDGCLLIAPSQRPKSEHVDHRDGLGPNGPRGFDPENFMAMSHPCHSRKTAKADGGFGNH
jgi:5-methylcytosine-specific restriction enzyme A